MTNSSKITALLNSASRSVTAAVRAPTGSSSKAQAAIDAYNALNKAISNIDERLVALEKTQEKGSVKD